MSNYRGYKTLLLEAELLSKSADAVYETLRKMSSEKGFAGPFSVLDEDIELALLRRNHPLIDLAIARYGRYVTAVREVFKGAEPGSALRIACLTNTGVMQDFIQKFPDGLIGNGSTEMVSWIESAPEIEIYSLFENPSLSDEFLESVLKRAGAWSAISDERLAPILGSLAANKRMQTPHDESWMDGYSNYMHNAVFNEAWRLSENLEVSRKWAVLLGNLFDVLQRDRHLGMEDPLAVAMRWQPDPADLKSTEWQEEDNKRGYLVGMQQVRRGLARLSIAKNGSSDRDWCDKLLTHDDLAFRCAAYSDCQLSPEQMVEASKRDGALFFNHALNNLSIWKNWDCRAKLSEIAWILVREDESSDLLLANLYKSKERAMEAAHPEWFRQEQEKVEVQPILDDELPATKRELAELSAQIVSEKQDLLESIKKAPVRLSWTWLLAIGVVMLIVRNI